MSYPYVVVTIHPDQFAVELHETSHAMHTMVAKLHRGAIICNDKPWGDRDIDMELAVRLDELDVGSVMKVLASLAGYKPPPPPGIIGIEDVEVPPVEKEQGDEPASGQ